MGYKAAIDAMTYLLASFHFAKLAYREIKRTGATPVSTTPQCVAARQEIETLVGLDEFYEIEEQTVEKKKVSFPQGRSSGRRRLAVGRSFQLDRISFRIGEVDRNAVALRAVAIANRTDGNVMPLQVRDDRFLIERFDAKAEMVEVKAACPGAGRPRLSASTRSSMHSPTRRCDIGELGSIGHVFRAQHVTVKSAHGVDVPDSQNQVVDVANLNLCHFASSSVGKRKPI